jgi:hypothetical protein
MAFTLKKNNDDDDDDDDKPSGISFPRSRLQLPPEVTIRHPEIRID